ncbi:hypothetical protein U27_04682 [Candidatus Vecturithrix granuli]|uniref:Uncharacterized protein n=1 Tax=Vecturithrix granuli TaxID=1499967 RepID=A0A081BZG0_VECG1|nr:hypothetical protein U27_04682 [Candidatus Vecturithrix granuli]
MSVGSPDAMKIRCPAKLQFRGRMTGARNWSFALHFHRSYSCVVANAPRRIKILWSGEDGCSAKLQFRGYQRCAKLEFRATFSGEMKNV